MNQKPDALLDQSIREVSAGFHDGRWTPPEIAAASLERLAQTEPRVQAWALVDAERALVDAARAESELRSGIDRGPLHGIPMGIKDIFDVAGWPTRCGSAARHDAPPAGNDATTIAALRDAGAVLLGKTVTQEFAAGVISKPARNPWDIARVPGGSSGGSAVAVALGVCYGAMGSDTGGSIRIPAAACGVVGFKPTFGELDVTGVYPLSWSLDTVGPLARNVDDAWIIWRALLGDAGQGQALHPSDVRLDGMRIGLLGQFFLQSVQPDIGDLTAGAAAALQRRGATIIEVEWAEADAARAAAFVLNRVETAAVHERTAREEPERFARFGSDLRLRVAAGLQVPAALYVKAERARIEVRESIARLFADHTLDAVLAPALPTTAVLAERPVIEGTGLEESIGAAWTRLTMPFNATGQPVLAVPAGFDRLGLPVGVQIAGRPGAETTIFEIGRALEQELDLGDWRPPLLQEIEHG